MIKKLLPFILIGFLAGYAFYDSLMKEKASDSTIENANQTEDVASGIGQPLEPAKNTNDNSKKTGIIESSHSSLDVEFAPDFTLSDMNGTHINLSDLRGKIVILNFWATWCPPCRAEMPHMQNFYEKNKDNGVEIIAVNLTALDEGKQAVEKFINEYGLTFPVVLDESGSVGKLYEILTIPTSYIIDAKGRIFQKFVGSMDEQIMEDMIKSIQMYDGEQEG
ncbi:peroxiredoxin [Ureibacillus xyleni]|uniref:Peroxiredoxin n=1 Tax=Ureibacillus xyleni TaxID=614648 RepID=A0A285THX8_9BACL|nr:redoxin domain-containing protein [Ureibacillus xyleni]SOC21663.1 peroxiredoxin [Ureibacillus xyleni]